MFIKILWSLNVLLIILTVLEISIYIMFILLFFYILNISFLISISEMDSWMSVIILIFLIGGLMVSFFYMASLSHNSMVMSSQILLIFPFAWWLSSNNFNMFYLMKMDKQISMESIFWSWNSKFHFYCYFLIFILLFIFVLLLFTDKKLKFIKGHLKEMF